MSTQAKSAADTLRENIEARTAEETAAANVNATAMEYVLAKTMEQLIPQAEMGDVPAENQYYSVGYCCQLFTASPPVVREIAKRAGVKFAWSMDGIPYFSGDAVLAMDHYLRSVREAKQ